jgi:hypothetical protein
VSARAVRALRERVARTPHLLLSIEPHALLKSVGPSAQREADPDLYVHGMLVHEGLRLDDAADEDDVVELELRHDHAVAGALWTTAAAVPIATIAFWAYGVMVALTGGAVAWALRRWWPVIARRAPGFLPRGRLLGAVTAATAIVLLGVAVLYPIREIRRPDNPGAVARALAR